MNRLAYSAGCLAVAVLALAGCAAAPEKRIIRLNPSTYYLHESGASPDSHWHTLMYRSAELTLASGNELMLLEPLGRQAVPDARIVSRDHTKLMPLGWSKSDTRVAVSPEVAQNWRPDGFDQWETYTTIESRILVRMIRRPLPDDILAAIDAGQIKSLLKAYVDSRGKVAVGEPWRIIQRSTLTHASITMPSADLISATRAVHANSGEPPSMELRDTSEFVDQFEEHAQQMHALYHSHRRSGGGVDGTVILDITVSPDGRVTQSRVVSTTITNVNFVESLRRMSTRFPFFREVVATTRVGWYPIVFTPQPK